MNSSPSGHAQLAAHADHPNGNLELKAITMHDLENELACFSEINTESSSLESSKISYLEQMLRLQEPRQLTLSQQRGRRFLLDMLSHLSQLSTRQQTQVDVVPGWYPNHPFKYLGYLLERSGRNELAQTVYNGRGVQDFQATDFEALGLWLYQFGIDGRELGLIQPNFFAGQQNGTTTGQLNLHPHFAALAEDSRSRSNDYLAEAFLSHAAPMQFPFFAKIPNRSISVEARTAAIASIYGSLARSTQGA